MSDPRPSWHAPSDSEHERKARELRSFYRRHQPRMLKSPRGFTYVDQADQDRKWRMVCTEYQRLFGEPSTDGTMERMLTYAWVEARELAGQWHDKKTMCWRNADGSRLNMDLPIPL